jgi:hypothetical protein
MLDVLQAICVCAVIRACNVHASMALEVLDKHQV